MLTRSKSCQQPALLTCSQPREIAVWGCEHGECWLKAFLHIRQSFTCTSECRLSIHASLRWRGASPHCTWLNQALVSSLRYARFLLLLGRDQHDDEADADSSGGVASCTARARSISHMATCESIRPHYEFEYVFRILQKLTQSRKFSPQEGSKFSFDPGHAIVRDERER